MTALVVTSDQCSRDAASKSVAARSCMRSSATSSATKPPRVDEDAPHEVSAVEIGCCGDVSVLVRRQIREVRMRCAGQCPKRRARLGFQQHFGRLLPIKRIELDDQPAPLGRGKPAGGVYDLGKPVHRHDASIARRKVPGQSGSTPRRLRHLRSHADAMQRGSSDHERKFVAGLTTSALEIRRVDACAFRRRERRTGRYCLT